MFSIVLNIIGTLLHLYVTARLYSIDAIRSRIPARAWIVGALLVWLVYFAGVRIGDEALDWRWWPGQFALTWLGILFVMALPLLAADLLTGFGFWWRAHAQKVRASAAIAGLLLAAFALFQGMRAPVIVEQEVVLKNLPQALDGTVIVAVSDIHLGAQRRSAWLARRVEQINALQPAAVLMLGDQVEDNPVGEAQLAPTLRALDAPLGVWAVTGNHEFYGDAETTVREFEEGGVRWLRDRQVELAPGLVLAGIEDIGAAMRRGGSLTGGLARTLSTPGGTATILMSHIPAGAVIDEARARGVDLMLSGHTHGGQIWPFSYAVQSRFPKYIGAHDIAGMTLYVTRGAGSWGPRMRLWQPGEIIKLTLRAPR
ncbi:metallophosphoesterase [Telluria aromaticivorans]|uniref:Metallophosphoesterase n=1 Tax=Telluria aromaticivorans TaxID=2725995 RepID=A0A7Y2JXR7_9BURK|nr:metallophosphoesterase [Telluria aromaticivorans]NNG22510.1 metallophosphoesterase [Telluria aromaticivorans]